MTCPVPWFTAAFYGACSDCGADIVPDDMVLPDGRGGYLCEGCGQEGYGCDC